MACGEAHQEEEKQLVNAAMDSDGVSLTKKKKRQKNWELTRFVFRESLN